MALYSLEPPGRMGLLGSPSVLFLPTGPLNMYSVRTDRRGHFGIIRIIVRLCLPESSVA